MTQFSWNRPHATVLPNGNLEWAPEPFVFTAGESIRYIDFEGGDDARNGLSPETAWRHHPWDSRATGAAREADGPHTYVFKGGVIYRGGTLRAAGSGTPEEPIRLTRDPDWGEGEAILQGSREITGGWQRANADEAPGIPDPEKVWFMDVGLDFDPGPLRSKFAALWQIDGETIERLHIARTPNDAPTPPNNPIANWPSWDRVDPSSGRFHSRVIRELHGADAQTLADTVIRATEPSLMGSAFPRQLGRATWNTEEGWITAPTLGDPAIYARHRAWNFFMMENAPQLLDSPGEYFFQRRGPFAGRLYLRPAGDVDPNTVRFEVPVSRVLIDIQNQSHIEISGLTFRFNDPDDGSRVDNTRHNTRPSHCIRILGNSSDITVRNNRFHHVADAVEARLSRVHEGGSVGQIMDNIFITDNDVRDASGAGIITVLGADYHPIHPEGTRFGDLRHVEVMRNRLVNTGFRGSLARWDSLPAISVSFPETCEIAGNMIDTSFGIGIITFGGKASGHADRTVPLIRYLVHHNQIENTLLGVNDYGGLEHFQGGPVYIYNNVSRNSVGNRSFWNHQLGYNLYLDGGFKAYAFNNILAGYRDPDDPEYFSHCGFFTVFGFLNGFFNNTLHRFEYGVHGSSGNRSQVLGNLFSEMSKSFITQNRPGDHSMLGGGDTGEMGRMGIPTMAYGFNLFHGQPETFGEIAGTRHREEGSAVETVTGGTLEELQLALADRNIRLAGLGKQVNLPPILDPYRQDYRPAFAAPQPAGGVKFFVPWALARVVGEWHFHSHPDTPGLVLGEHFFMTRESAHRDMYYFLPRNDLTVTEPVSPRDYIESPLEDWIAGALLFDGSRTATLAHEELIRDMTYPLRDGSEFHFEGSRRETVDMSENSFILEMVFQTQKGHTEGTLVAKRDDGSGYGLEIGKNGRPRLVLLSDGGLKEFAGASEVNTGMWHHLLVEVDRAGESVKFYMDGKAAGGGNLKGLELGSLENGADFEVGRDFKGAVAFLRISRGTLEESRTTIEELYAWQFNGPHLRDLRGRTPEEGRRRTAGALLFQR